MADADLDAALTSLRTHLDLADEGSLWAVVVSTLGAQERVADELARGLSDRRVERFRFRGDSLSLASRLRAMPEDSEGVLLALDLDALPREARRKAIALLNRGREALVERRWHVVLFVSPETRREVISTAGDFWSWRRGVSECTQLFEGVDFDAERDRLRGRYLEALLERTREYPLPQMVTRRLAGLTSARSLRSSRTKLPEFDGAYLPPRALRTLAQEGERPEWVPLGEALGENDRLLVVADQGEGRSRLLQYALREEAKRALEATPGARVPIALSCAAVRALAGDRERCDLVDVIAPLFSREALGAFSSVALDALERGEALLVVDDFDDLHDSADRASVSAWIEHTLSMHPGVCAVVVATPEAWRGTALEDGWVRLGLPTLSVADVAVLIERLTGQQPERLQFDVRNDSSLRTELARPFNAVLYGVSALEGRSRWSSFIGIFAHLRETLSENPRGVRNLELLSSLAVWSARTTFEGDEAFTLEALTAEVADVPDLEREAVEETVAWLIKESGLLRSGGDRVRWTRAEYLSFALLLRMRTGPSRETREAIIAQRHRAVWSAAFALMSREDDPSYGESGAEWRRRIFEAAASAFEDLLFRDALMQGAFLAANLNDSSVVAVRDRLFEHLDSEWARRLPELAWQLVQRLSARVTSSLESASPTDDRSFALARHADETLALDGILLLLSSTRANILSPVELTRVADALRSPRRVVRTRAWRCVELIAVDLDALAELASYAFGDARIGELLTRAAALSVTQRSPETRGDNAWGLGLSLLRSAAREASPTVRAAAATGIACDASIEPDAALLSDPEPEVRAAALSAWRGALSVEAVAPHASDPSAVVRSAAARALARSPSAETLALLVALRVDADADVRLAAVTALRGFDAPDARAALFDALCDAVEAVRVAAAAGLRSAFHDVDALDEALSAHTASRAWSTSDAALAGARLGLRHDRVKLGLHEAMLRARVQRDTDLLRSVVEVIPRVNDDALGDAVMRPLLEHLDAGVRAAAWEVVRALPEMPACCGVLAAGALRDGSPAVRVAAAKACEVVLDDAATRDAWVKLLDDGDASVVEAAARLLRDAGVATRWETAARVAICDELAARLRDAGYRAAAADETLAALWTALRDVVAALTEERIL